VNRLDVIGDPELRRTLLFVRAQERPATADEVASTLGVPRSAARWRLEKLVEAGVVVSAFERRSGRSGPGAGRPAKTYAPAAETSALEFPLRRFETLVDLLIGVLPRRRRSARLVDVGIAFGRELAQAAAISAAPTVAGGFERLQRGFAKLGFHAAFELVSSHEAVITSATCPLRPLVVKYPDGRAIDEGMWRGLVESSVRRPAGISCATFDCRDEREPCRVVVTWT
jgi:predicted ArsR family transcriptional regulator